MQYCHTCNNSKKSDQLLYCQGCSSSFHRNCIGYRSGREHQATKVGHDNFVLQCRYCIGVHKKRDDNAPCYSMCQECKKHGPSCAPFSPKKTSRQEEKIREENGGVDPVTQVPTELINNANNVLFRCTTCYRAWHQDHIPWTRLESIETDLKEDRPKTHSRDWRCEDCNSTEHKMHRLVAWRPVKKGGSQQAVDSTAHDDFTEDWKEYLVKWQDRSHAHCTWMPGAWIYGVAASGMRNSFAKHAAQSDLLKLTTKEAIPDEYLMPDIIFNVKMAAHIPKGRSRHDDLANISSVAKIFVKFQGLGYDDVVWDSAPTPDNPDMYNSFVEAYREYLAGRYFRTEPYTRIRDRARAYKNEDFEELDFQPEGLKRGKLMGYQMEGLNWLLQNYHHGRNVVLADEMGLGKTVQVIALVTSLVLDKPKCWPFLIVVPNSTCPNWRREFKQWAPDIRVVTYHGGKESQELAYKYELFPNGSAEMRAQVVIMSYDSASDQQTQSLFKSVNWAGLVVDEGQRLKNEQSLLYLALRAMKIPFRLLLTGTPLQNNKRELFNLLQFIDESQKAAKLDEQFEVLDKETLPQLHDKIRPYFLRRTKAGVLKFLPPMAQIILPVTMTVIQQKLSKSIMAKNPQLIKAVFANSKMGQKERGSLNNILMQLRKCLCHPFMYSDAIEERHQDPSIVHRNLVEASAKLLLLELMLPKLRERGHRVLIFSQFLQQLDIVEDFLAGIGFDYRRLDGSISSLEKQRRIDAFNEPGSEVFAFLLSTRAGGVGINLATADTVIIMDPDFNPHQDMQALSRAHRIGQKNKVLCFQLVTKDSVEEQIMQVGRKKMALDHALIESMDDDELAGDDLESILKRGAQALFDENYEKAAIHYDSASVDQLLDRSQVEQTATNDEGSGETQFTYARVWSNNKLGFEENQDLGEEQAPEPINSSVWDQILAQREEEARREAEANKEVLGRGARRRNKTENPYR
ncbi:Chromatin remodeling factor mit1 [Escovopsis weberi]|uniref:Chromatin remodeling factor mit1 n=1 Tax=Escovopsis weberi TaxID=150374 RepID=A0A0M9VUN4_ESCWE|nr:Chromatin remodeling factor mit1 [Escovopsis weberi]